MGVELFLFQFCILRTLTLVTESIQSDVPGTSLPIRIFICLIHCQMFKGVLYLEEWLELTWQCQICAVIIFCHCIVRNIYFGSHKKLTNLRIYISLLESKCHT